MTGMLEDGLVDGGSASWSSLSVGVTGDSWGDMTRCLGNVCGW